MQILSRLAALFAFQVPIPIRVFRFLLRFSLLGAGIYVLQQGRQQGLRRAAQRAAELKAYQDALLAETERYFDTADTQMTSIYRGINTVLAYAGVEPIGDGQ